MAETTNAGGFDTHALERFSASVQSDIDNGNIYGASVLLARHGKVGLRKSFGAVSPDGREPHDDSDLFLMMSLSKSFTAALVLHAVDQGRFTLDTKAGSILPAFGVKGKENVTVRHLLTHTAGTYDAMVPPGFSPMDLGNLDKNFEAIAAMPAAYVPGTQCIYNPQASYATLAQMLVATDPAKRAFRDIARQDLFEPLGMVDTNYGIQADNPRRVPACLTPKLSKPETPGLVKMLQHGLENDAQIPAGNAFSTVADVYRFTEMIRGRGTQPNGGCRYISKATFDYAARNHTGDLKAGAWQHELQTSGISLEFPANFSLLGGYVRNEGHVLCGSGFTSSPNTLYAVGGGTTMWMVDPARDLTFIYVSCGFVEGLAHFARLRRLSDLALAACE